MSMIIRPVRDCIDLLVGSVRKMFGVSYPNLGLFSMIWVAPAFTMV
jgi:hypothetical protein